MANKKHNNFYKTSEEFRNFLKDSGLTQEDFAKKVGISRATIKNWINQGGVTYGNWAKISAAFGHKLAILNPKERSSTPTNLEILTAQLQALEDKIKDKEKIIDLQDKQLKTLEIANEALQILAEQRKKMS